MRISDWSSDVCSSDLNIQQMDVQTYFFRRKNMNAKGQPRSWTDHLLWHHAAHTVDLFAYQAGRIVKANAVAGPIHPELGIARAMSIQLKTETGADRTSVVWGKNVPVGVIRGRRQDTICALVTGVQTCALPISTSSRWTSRPISSAART